MRLIRWIVFPIACAVIQSVHAYPVTTPFSSYEVLDEPAFFSLYTDPMLVIDLYDKGDSTQPDSWLVRGYWGGSGFWEDVSFGDPYPVLRTGPSGPGPQPQLSITAPASLVEAVPLAIYTNRGFLGIIPDGPDDKFYRVAPEIGNEPVTQINGIYTVTRLSASPVSMLPVLPLFMLGLAAMVARRSLTDKTSSGRH